MNVIIYKYNQKQQSLIKILEKMTNLSIFFAFEKKELESISEKFSPAMIFGEEEDFRDIYVKTINSSDIALFKSFTALILTQNLNNCNPSEIGILLKTIYENEKIEI